MTLNKITANIQKFLDYIKITEVNLSAFIYSLFHDDFSSILGTNPDYYVFKLSF